METENAPVTLKEIFFKRNDMAAGRRTVVLHTLINSVASTLATGVFYSAFLLEFGINITSISVLAFMPYFASFISLFSPAVLRRLKKRRWVLFAAKLAAYALQIGCTTLIPFVFKTSAGRTVGFCILLLLASLLDNLFSPGYTDWHIKFVPDKLRAKFFSAQLTLNNLFPWAVSVLLSLVADRLKDTPQYTTAILLVRLLAFALALTDCVILLLPKEFSYETSAQKTRLSDVFRIPLSNRRFRKTMLIYFFYVFYASINAGILNAYFLDVLKRNLTTINFINSLYGIIFLLISGLWQLYIRKKGWFRCLFFTNLLIIPAYIGMACATAENAWLMYPLFRLAEHFPSVGRTLAATNLIYINTPEKDSYYYYSISTPIGNLATLAGLMVGSVVSAMFGSNVISIGMGLSINYGQCLYLMQAVLGIAFCVLTRAWAKQLDPSYKD